MGEGLRRAFGGHDVVAKAVGIGLAMASVGAALRLQALRPRAVVLVGTCGAYAGALALGKVAVARRVVLAEPAVARGEAAFPDPMSSELLADAALGAGMAARAKGTAKLVDVATTLAVTTSDPLAAVLAASTQCQAEHLEAYGVAAACAQEGIPFVAALGVANDVGSKGREQWRANHRMASEAAIGAVLEWMGDGAPGLARPSG